ncbi:MAG: hypothetical protein OER88_06765, partial [Planctomycetota bacterium]|nr:hypothetical protein [Planctomycetota bacterium]
MTIEELRREIRTALRQDVARARRLVRRFARAAERQDDAALRAEALLMRAEVEDMAQRPKRALHKYRAAERAFSRCGSARQQAAVQIGIVQVCAELGDPKTVRRAAQKLRSLDLESRARAGSAIAIATAYETLGDARSAEAGYRDALRDLGRGRHPTVRFLRGTAAQNLAVCLGRRGAVREARRALARADRDFADLDVAHAHAIVRFTRGWLAGLAGDVALAQEELAAAHTAFLDAGDPKMSGLARLDLAALALGLGDTETAIEHAKQAERALRGRDFRVDAARARLQQARALARAGSAGRARTHARRAAETFDAAGDRAGAAHARVVAGEASGRTERTLREHGHFLGGLEALIAHARSSPPRRGATLLRERARGYPPVLRRWVQPELWGLRARGEPERAIPHLRRAVRAVEGLRRLAPVARLRATALASHLEWYDALAQALLARGRAADRREAFAVLDAARARTLHDEMERDAPGLGQTPRVRTLRRRLEQLWRAIEREERGSGDLRTSMP